MRITLVALLVLAGAARADDPPSDPEGTMRVELEVGDATDAPARAAATVICDDPSIVAPELTGDGGTSFVLRGIKVGTTLCGVRQEGQIPAGLYRLVVKPKKAAPVQVEVQQANGMFELSVRNSGPAIPEEKQAQLFKHIGTQILRFVDDQHCAPPLRVRAQQMGIDSIDQHLDARPNCWHLDMEFVADAREKFFHAHLRVENESDVASRLYLLEQASA